jgi:hypothetical protein
MKPEAQWYLVDALARVRALLGVQDDLQAKRAHMSHFAGVLAGFRYLGVVTQDEETVWNHKMLATLGLVGPDPPPPGFNQAVFVGDPERAPAPHDVSRHPLFVRSIPGPDQEFDVHGGRIRVITVEIFDTAVSVRWRVAPLPDISLAFPEEAAALESDMAGLEEGPKRLLRKDANRLMGSMRLYQFSLVDDIGTAYRPQGGGHGGGTRETTGEARFEPAPPSSASRLTLTWLGLQIQLPIP